MPREVITIQVGQCGNQVGLKFWDQILKEQAQYANDSIYDESLSVFFQNKNNKSRCSVGSTIKKLKARAVIVDTEEGVINQLLKDKIGEIFDQRQNLLFKINGFGCLWCREQLGPWSFPLRIYVRRTSDRNYSIMYPFDLAVEPCDSLQSFFLMHSLGGGTGSGFGTYILGLLQDYYPHIYRFTTSVFPNNDDHVVTSPFNSLLSLNQLMEHADCVFPVDNQALLNICEKLSPEKTKKSKNLMVENDKKSKPFDQMNSIVGQMLTQLTCSMRFEGQLNIDLNEITTNLVPYPKMKYLVSSLSPLYMANDLKLRK